MQSTWTVMLFFLRLLVKQFIELTNVMVYSIKFSITLSITMLLIFGLVFPLIVLWMRMKYKKLKAKRGDKKKIVGIFHPYCNAGGGGERVLWCAIKALQDRYDDVEIHVYTGDLDASPADIIKRASTIFNVSVSNDIKFVYLHRRMWVEAKRYPYFTLLGQSIGSIWMGLEALNKLQPDIYIDTMGYAFTLPIFKFIGTCKVASYVHYPTITQDMMIRVSNRTASHNNRNIIASSPFLTYSKLLYYRLFGYAYLWVGRLNDTIMVNSTWTEDHINNLWESPLKTHRVYPPCDVKHLKTIKHVDIETVRIVSVGQFRPEKDHPLQLRAMYELRQRVSEDLWSKIKLVFIGSVRNDEDRVRVKDMEDLCKHLSLENNVEFHINATYKELLEEFSKGLIGMHSMWNEHFGIGVVECMAAGLIMIAHRSGGPLMDIIETSEGCRTGYLATNSEEYAQAIVSILQLTREQMAVIRNAARASVDRFTSQEFEKGFLRATHPLFN